MKLRRRYVRNIRQNLSFYIASTVLTMAALFLFFLFHIAGNAILDFADEFFEKQKLEDAHFTTYIPISESDIEDMEEEYGVTLEAQSYINIDTDGTTARIFQKTREVDLYDVTEGEDADEKGEVILSEGYAVNMDISTGDQIRIGEEDYTVTGFFQRPDYLYMLENEDDSYKNISTFFLAYMSEEDFAELGEPNCQYLVRYSGDNDRYSGNDEKAFRKAVNEKYHMHSYTSAEENQRIVMVRSQAEMFLIMSWMLLCILPLVAVALICIIISRKVKTEQQMIGTLSAMGYTRTQLARHYAGFAAIPGIIGGVLTSVVTAVAAQPYGELGLTDYEPMRISCSLSWYAAVLGIVIPTVMYVLAALLSVRRLLRQNTVLLLNGSGDEGRRKLRRVLAGRKLSFRIKFAVRSLIGSPARSFVVFLGVFLGSFIMLTGFSIYDSAVFHFYGRLSVYYSDRLRGAANETHEFPSQSRMDIMYPLIVENLTYVKSHPHIVPTFRGTVQAISQKYGIPAKLIHTTLSEMISKGLVIQKEQTSPDGRTARIISGNWKELSKEGLVE